MMNPAVAQRTSFPRVPLDASVSAEDQASAIDFVNRVNWLFETWEVEAMVEAFLPDAVTYHFHGVIRGRNEVRRFFDEEYPYLVPGVSRHATNHVVDRDGDGVAVRYHNLLVRYATLQAARDLGSGQVSQSDELPAIWIYSPMLDRLRRTSGGWRIAERHVGGSMTSGRYDPGVHAAAAIAPFLPRPGEP